MATVRFTVNAEVVTVNVPGAETLLQTLRDRLGLRSVRYACGIGVCGTCSVLLDERSVSSCLTLTATVGDRAVRTAEGFDPDERIVRAFVECGAFQCSYCIPGMVVTTAGMLASTPGLGVRELREALGGNLCRCGSYPQVLEAVQQIAGPVESRAEGNSRPPT